MCSGITETDLEISDDVKTQIESLRFSELYNADGFSDIKYFQYLRKCLKTCGVYDFGWKDLHMPNSKRLRQQLSALINLVKFRAEQLQILAELNEPVSCVSIECTQVLCCCSACVVCVCCLPKNFCAFFFSSLALVALNSHPPNDQP